jgi:NADH-ubiquinone oxidoreductase chain 4
MHRVERWVLVLLSSFISSIILLLINFINHDSANMGYMIELTTLSLRLGTLSCWISLLILTARQKVIKKSEFSEYYNFLILLLILILLLTFFSTNILEFYFYFEVSLIPTIIIIMGWGYQPERLQAGIYFLFYTLSASLPLLLVLIYSFNIVLSLEFYYGDLIEWPRTNLMIIGGIGLIGAFLVKMPIFLTHLWLPRAHVEAPVAGSIILAGILLKLGGFGLIIISSLIEIPIIFFRPYIVGLSLVGILLIGIICLRINDFKAIVAYSSVAHIGIVISGITRVFLWGYTGALIIMLGHGLASSGLFSIVNIYYERLRRRSFYINKGFIIILPIFTFLFFLLSVANIAAPPTINLLSEIILIVRILGYSYWIIIVFPLGSFLGAVFTLYIFSYSQHGKVYNSLIRVKIYNVRELHNIIIHLW